MINGGRNQLPRMGRSRSVATATNVAMTDDEIIHGIREQDVAGELPKPVPPEAVAELEAVVGHPMPPLLKRIHLEVADGG